jgi:hypothetical protein
MLTAATLGLCGYGLYIIGAALADVILFSRLEIWANLGDLVLGMTLLVAAVLVRTRIPGGLLFALGGLLGLQALHLHNSMHLHGSIQLVPEAARAVFCAVLLLLGWWGGKREVSGTDAGETREE